MGKVGKYILQKLKRRCLQSWYSVCSLKMITYCNAYVTKCRVIILGKSSWSHDQKQKTHFSTTTSGIIRTHVPVILCYNVAFGSGIPTYKMERKNV